MLENDIDRYKKQLNLQDAHFAYIEHEDAMVAEVFKVTAPKRRPLILKICSQDSHYLREVYFLNHFREKLPVARIIQLLPPTSDLHGAILMEHLSGNLLQVEDINANLMHEIGSLLARIHFESASAYGDLIRPDTLTTDARIPFRIKFEEGLAECQHHLPHVLIEKSYQYFDRHIDLLLSADGPRIVHRDFRPGNLIVEGDKVQGIIDWASARAGCAEEDFCPLDLGAWSTHPAHIHAFLEGYAQIRPVPPYKRIMPLLLLDKAIATIGFTVKRGTWETKGAKIYQLNRQYLEQLLKNSQS